MSFPTDAWIVDGVRTPFGRYRGAVAGVRADDLGALPIKALQERNRLCGSSLDAVGLGARSIRAGDAQLVIADGVESMTRAPFVMGKAELAFSRAAKIEDTTRSWP